MSDAVTPPSALPAGFIRPSVLVLVRHGETAGNRNGHYQTYDTPLSDVGRAQAARLAERLRREGSARALYASDLARMHGKALFGKKPQDLLTDGRLAGIHARPHDQDDGG